MISTINVWKVSMQEKNEYYKQQDRKAKRKYQKKVMEMLSVFL